MLDVWRIIFPHIEDHFYASRLATNFRLLVEDYNILAFGFGVEVRQLDGFEVRDLCSAGPFEVKSKSVKSLRLSRKAR